MSSIRDYFAGIIDSSETQSLLTLTSEQASIRERVPIDFKQLGSSWNDAKPDCTWQHRTFETFELELSTKIDLALVGPGLELMEINQGKMLLAQLRNFGSQRIVVTMKDSSEWTFNDFIALGFRKERTFSDQGNSITVYSYNLDTYNHKRTWNNPRFWANPEMWNKSRW